MVRQGRQAIDHILQQLEAGRVAVALLGDRLADVAHQVGPELALNLLVLQRRRKAVAGAVDVGLGRETALARMFTQARL